MAYLCKYCNQKFDSRKLMVLRNCSKSPTGKHAPAGAVTKAAFGLGVLIGILFGLFELANYLHIPEKLSSIFSYLGGKIEIIINFVQNILQS
jgi:hypothetical protein